jgi:hypothetical protein
VLQPAAVFKNSAIKFGKRGEQNHADLEYREMQRYAISVGLDDIYRVSVNEAGLVFAAKGGWVVYWLGTRRSGAKRTN